MRGWTFPARAHPGSNSNLQKLEKPQISSSNQRTSVVTPLGLGSWWLSGYWTAGYLSGADSCRSKELVDASKLAPFRYDQVAILINRSAMRRVADAFFPLI